MKGFGTDQHRRKAFRERLEMGGALETNGEKHTHQLELALAYAENIIATLREPFVVLDKTLRVRTANAAFYRDFHVLKEETEGRFVYELGNGQWDIPQLRTLLTQVLSNSHPVEDFEVEHAFPDLGQRNMLLNARRFPSREQRPGSGPARHRRHHRPQSCRSRRGSTPKSGIGGCSRWPKTASSSSPPTRAK